MQVKLRFPNGSNHRGRFWKGTPRSALIWLACSSEWAQQVRPAGVSLSMGHPPELLSTEGELTEDFANAMIIVKEVRAEDLPIDSNVESQEADVQPTENENAATPPEEFTSVREADAQPTEDVNPVTPQEEMSLSSAAREEESFASMEEPEEQNGPATPQDPVRAPAPANPAMQSQSNLITQVTDFTGADRDRASAALREANWDVQRACNLIMDAQNSTRELLAARHSRRTPPPAQQRSVGATQQPWARAPSTAGGGQRLVSSGNYTGDDWIRDCGLGAAAGCVSACAVAICVSVFG